MPKIVADLVSERFGVKVRAVQNPKITSVGTTAQEILANNPNRVAWLIMNLSTNTLYLAFTNDVASTKSMGVFKQGEGMVMNMEEDLTMPSWAVWAVASGASSAVYAVEFVTY